MSFEDFFEKCTMAFGMILYHFQQFSLAMALVQIHSPRPSLIFGSCFASNPASWTSLYDYFPFNLIKKISALYSSPWRFTKELPFLFWFLPPNLFPILVLWTLNKDPWRSTGLQFKFFKLSLLQVWTRFVKFDEIHSNPSPKILGKIRQPLGALRGHLTKSQPQEKFSSCQIILSNTLHALFLSIFS